LESEGLAASGIGKVLDFEGLLDWVLNWEFISAGGATVTDGEREGYCDVGAGGRALSWDVAGEGV